MYPNWDFWFENKQSGNPDWEDLKQDRVFFGLDGLHSIAENMYIHMYIGT
jgi:hypothetical protein